MRNNNNNTKAKLSMHDNITMFAFVVAFFCFLLSSGCAAAPTGTIMPERMTPEQHFEQNKELSTPIDLPSEIRLKVGETFRFKKPANTTWKSANMGNVMVGQKDGFVILTAINPGKAEIYGQNDYYFTLRQEVEVIVVK